MITQDLLIAILVWALCGSLIDNIAWVWWARTKYNDRDSKYYHILMCPILGPLLMIIWVIARIRER